MRAFSNILKTNTWKREDRLCLASSSDGGDREAESSPLRQFNEEGGALASGTLLVW